MKMLLLAGTALLALTVSEPAAHAQRVNFTYTGKLVTWTVPKSGTYQILAFGAQGGSFAPNGPVPLDSGGLGAEIGGDFVLTAGEDLQIAVGGVGGTVVFSFGGGGGGGGSFVVAAGNVPLVIAGGGGGGGQLYGGDGLIGSSGGSGGSFPVGPGFVGGAGGTNGNGGSGSPSGVSGGGVSTG